MNLKVHHSGQDKESVWAEDTMDFINRLLRIGKVLKGLEVQYQSDALIGNRFHVRNITDHVNAGGIKVLPILLDIIFTRKERPVKIRLPSSAGVENRVLKGKMPNRPFHIVNDRLSQLGLLPSQQSFRHR